MVPLSSGAFIRWGLATVPLSSGALLRCPFPVGPQVHCTAITHGSVTARVTAPAITGLYLGVSSQQVGPIQRHEALHLEHPGRLLFHLLYKKQSVLTEINTDTNFYSEHNSAFQELPHHQKPPPTEPLQFTAITGGTVVVRAPRCLVPVIRWGRVTVPASMHPEGPCQGACIHSALLR